MDAPNYEHTALTFHDDKMLTSILIFLMSNDKHFGSDMSSDRLEVLALSLLTDQLEPVTMTICQMGCEDCKKKL